MVDYLTQFLEVRNKNGTVVSDDIRLTAKDDKFITFEDINRLYKKIASKYKTKNIMVLTTNPAGLKSMIKKNGEILDDLALSTEDYYNKLNKQDRKKFDQFTSVQFIFKKQIKI
jgi:hypothetical protein